MDYTPTNSELTTSIAEFNSAGSPTAAPTRQPEVLPPAADTPLEATFRWGESAEFELHLDWSGDRVRTSLRAKKSSIFQGEIRQEALAGTQSLAAAGPWQEVCRETDEHAELVELEQPLEQGFKLQRQFVVLPKEDVLFLADALLGPDDGRAFAAGPALEHRLQLPLADGLSFTAAEKTYEGVFAKRRPVAQVFPLALPEWRRGARVGELAAEGKQLQLSVKGTGRRVYAPLVIDLRSRRFKQPFTWRKLTVAENLLAVPDELAVGYRVQLGPLQLLVYRSLGPRGNRTLLGHNLCAEFLVARFSRKGEVESWMEIE